MNTKKATPQQQQMYDTVMVNARKVIYGTSAQDGQRFEILVQKLKGAKGEIGDAIGNTVAIILTNVSGALQKNGAQVSPDILFAAGRELVTDLIGIAQAAGIIPPGKQSAIEQQALAAGVKAYKKGQQPAPAQPAAPPAAQPPTQPPVQPPAQPPQGV